MTKTKFFTLIALCHSLMLHAEPASAYLGPGGALSGIGSLLALLAAILLAILGFLWFPIKRLIAKFRKKDASADQQPDDQEGAPDPAPATAASKSESS